MTAAAINPGSANQPDRSRANHGNGVKLRKAFRDAVIVDGLIGSNPVERAKRPRMPTREPGTVWTVAQLQAFLATAGQHRLFAFFHLAAYTGARRGELLNLRWTDVDLDAKKIAISGSTAVIGGERINGTTKSGRTRVIAIDDGTAAVLRQHRAGQAAEQTLAGDYWRGTSNGLCLHHWVGRAHLPRHRQLPDDQVHPRPQRA
jgi:integrase